MLYFPQHTSIQKHIDYYWIVNESSTILKEIPQTIYAYPGITPDMLLVLDGYYMFKTRGIEFKSNVSTLFSFIDQTLQVDLSGLKSFILIKFKSKALSSLLPFVPFDASKIMQNPIIPVHEICKKHFMSFLSKLKTTDDSLIVQELDHWFLSNYLKEREGLTIAIMDQADDRFDLQRMMRMTKYSYSTIERHFKRDTGLTPKKYESLQRYKSAVQEICRTKNTDWQYYINKYHYYDQSHFIKEIKRYTSLTPKQILTLPSFTEIRPL
ncbi:AraC family transcriptional regulator [Aquimarina sp. ERC-38]|uniref:helix-turn-helix domain-containing protein n=1 Tax=Aquimarina sp. ERC-38 TaxID=2949996 RepID=UPI0022477259|nr:AraC family transcriptional regulator [Aquimarina sp. ERC-38]UZO82558.1 AraC family transcriptional regulator [Aquimarina sp. ERC-38]